MRIEQSKAGYPIDEWLALVSSGLSAQLHQAAVITLGDESRLSSCGMHVFSLPDAQVELRDASTGAGKLVFILNAYQLDEDPVLLSGQTFSPDTATPPRVAPAALARYALPARAPLPQPVRAMEARPDGRQGAAAARARAVFIPTLVSILAALERKHGRPLTEAEVEQTTQHGVCMAMQQRDAQQLERSRGYADIDPELAWEQWQLASKMSPRAAKS